MLSCLSAYVQTYNIVLYFTIGYHIHLYLYCYRQTTIGR
jgi:hypothetical protein